MKKLLGKLTDNPSSLNKEESNILLEELRGEVNILDKQIAQLLIKRISLSIFIAKVKKLLNLPSYSPEQEKKIINNVVSVSPDELSKKIVKSIYERVIDESRGIQKMRFDNEQE